jgi:3-hydroxypropanoate dehydrogenase
MPTPLPDAALDQLFRHARTPNDWVDESIGDATVHALYDLLKWGPTSANSSPARFVWVRSAAGKSRLSSLAMEGNRAKILAAPLTVIIGNDLAFPATMPKLFPARAETMQQWFSQPGVAEITASRNGTLQGAYLIIAARSLGLDCGPMSGFDNAAVDVEFFAGTRIESNFICCVGHGKPESVFPRNPRLTFDEAGKFA